MDVGRYSCYLSCGARVSPLLTGENLQFMPTGVINWVAVVELCSSCSAVLYRFVSWDSGPAWLSFAPSRNGMFVVGREIWPLVFVATFT